jgi:hypothetical protein
MSNQSPNAQEEQLINQIKTAVTSKSQHDRDGLYIENSPQNLKDFKKISENIANLIENQSPQKTCSSLILIARHLQNLDAADWERGDRIGYALSNGLKAAEQAGTSLTTGVGNRLKNLKL